MPAWIHPLRLTTLANAHARVSGICSHLQNCLTSTSAHSLSTVIVPPYSGVEHGTHDRGEVERCVNHAKLIAFALRWAMEHEGAKAAIVVECHCAQSSGAADFGAAGFENCMVVRSRRGPWHQCQKET